MLQIIAQLARLAHGFLKIMRQHVFGQMLFAVLAPLVDGLHVHLGDRPVHELQPLGLAPRGQMDADCDIRLDVRDGRHQLVAQVIREIPHQKTLVPYFRGARAQPEPPAVRHVHGERGHVILRGHAMRFQEAVLVEHEPRAATQHPVQHLQPGPAVQAHADAAAHRPQLRRGTQHGAVQQRDRTFPVPLAQRQRQILVRHRALRTAGETPAHIAVEVPAQPIQHVAP